MPKDWASHKAEVEQLYIEQGRTLKEVRDILKDRHGFSASVRAYRMRIDDWDLRKYRSRKERSGSSTYSTTSPGLTGSSTSPQSMKSQGQSSAMEMDGGDNMHFGPFSIPTAPMKSEDIFTLVQGLSANIYLVEILLTKWQRGGEYLDTLSAYLQRLDTCEGLIRTANDGKPTLFKLVEQHVPINEQFAVGKLILEKQFSIHRKPDADDAQWLKVWTIACGCTEWEEAKETLNESGRVEWLAGSLFLGCAQVVIAEQLLRRYIKHFRGLKDPDGRYSKTALPKAEACRKRYLDILDDLKSIGDTPLRPLFYKHSLEVIE
ncbi:Clr5 domain-containing protein, partial [Halenospora varia]